MSTSLAQVIQPDPLVFEPDVSLKTAIAAMSRARTSYVLVMTGETLVGILSEQEIIQAIAAAVELELPIAALMSRQVATCSEAEAADISLVLERLRQQQIRYLPVLDAAGQVIGVVTPETIQAVLQQEISERQQLTRTLAESKTRYCSILNNLPDLVCCYQANGLITFANRAYCCYFNKPLEELLGRSFLDLLPAATRQIARQSIDVITQTKGSQTCECQTFDATGRQHWMQWTDLAVCDDAGDILEFQAIGRDITDRKQAEATLQESEARNQAILGAIPDLLLRVRRDGTCIDCILPVNPREAEFLPIQYNVAEVLSPETLQLELQIIEQALNTGELQLFEHQLVKRGKICYEEVRVVPCEDEALLMVRDVTRQRQKEMQFQRLTENVPGVVYRYVLSPDGRDYLTYVSPCCRELIELEAEVVLEDLAGFWSLTHPDDIAWIRQTIIDSAQSLQPWSTEFRLILPSGKQKWVRTISQPERQPNGEILWDGLMIDITDSKRASDALQASEAKLRSVLENTPSVIILIDRQGTTLFINRSLLGRTVDTLIGHSIADYLSPQPDQLKIALANVFEQGESTSFEADGIGQTQLVANYEVYIAPVQDSEPIEAAIVIAVDISVRKQAEAVLRQRETQLRLALEAGKIVCWEYDFFSQQTTCIGRHRSGNRWQPETYQISSEASSALIHPDDRAEALQKLAAAIATRTEYEDVYRLLFPDESTTWVLAKSKLFVDASGARMVGVSIDISERKQVEADLEAQRAFLREIIDAVGSAIFVKDTAGRFLTANQASADIYGVTVEELIGKSTSDFSSDPIQVESYSKTNQEVMKSRQKVTVTEAIKNFRGESHWYRTTINPFIDTKGEVQGVIGVIADITDLKQVEEALRQAKEAAEAANLAKSQFLANMSHELRTPLNSILGFAQLLSHDCLTSEQQEQLGIILHSGEHLLELINDVLEMSKIDAGRMTLNATSFDLYQLLENLQETMRLKATAKGLKLIFDRSSNLPQYIKADESKLRQVLFNLIGNAIKFTLQGRVIVRVRVIENYSRLPSKTEQQSAEYLLTSDLSNALQAILADPNAIQLYFAVDDTGIGIAPSEISSLFNPFVQTEAGRQSQEGTGLGLAISRRFVELMGGKISVRSIKGKGATFEFNIPACRSNLEMPISSKPGQIVGLASPSAGYRVLVVEDQIANRKLVVQLLTKLGFVVKEADNGDAATQLWQQWSPHLVLMDMRMPVMNGYEATQRIRELERKRQNTSQGARQNTPTLIIALTASAFEEERLNIFSAGCDGYVLKPFKSEDLLIAIAKHLKLDYVYAEEPVIELNCPARGSSKATYPPLTSALLMPLSETWKLELHQAAAQLDVERCIQLIQSMPVESLQLSPMFSEQISEYSLEQLREQLLGLVNDFRFDVLIDLTDAMKSVAVDSGS